MDNADNMEMFGEHNESRRSDCFVIALDQGTTSSRALLIDRGGNVVDSAQYEFRQIFPHPGWVEHDPMEILSTQLRALEDLIERNSLDAGEVAALGISNQRETVVVWDRHTGEPVYNAIVWQCRRTVDRMASISENARLSEEVRLKTGLIPDAYFSASKIEWILDNVAGARAKAEAGDLIFGTVDTWLLWNLTCGEVHATDATNASRTLLFDIRDMCWDKSLLEVFSIPASMLPEVHPSAGIFGEVASGHLKGVPIAGIAGDQQAALFGQLCVDPGQAKCTYGTGCFLLMNVGATPILSDNSLVTTVAASAPGMPSEYALEGSVFMGGALMQWVRDELHLLEDAADSERMANELLDTGGVTIVPAFTGLGAPHWNGDARGIICGITRGTTGAHLVRAALEAIAFQVRDLAVAMEADAHEELSVLNVDGGAADNDFLMQFQADILGTEIRRPHNKEATAMGAAYLAGLAVGFWSGMDELRALQADADRFTPCMDSEERDSRIVIWNDAIARCLYQPCSK